MPLGRLSSRVENFPAIGSNIESTNVWLVFEDKIIQGGYEKFRSVEYSSIQFALMALFFTCMIMITAIEDTALSYVIHPEFLIAYYLKVSSSIMFTIIVIIPLWMIAIHLYRGGNMHRNNRFTFLVELFVIFGGSICVGTTMLAIALGAEVHTRIFNATAFAATFPGIMSTVFKHPNLKILFLSWTILFILITASMALTKIEGVLICLFSLVLIYQTYCMEYRTIFLYRKELSQKRLTDSIATLEAQKDSKFIENLRHMIGNVAHDLKTPTQSFSVCLEQLEFSVDSLRETFSSYSDKDMLRNILDDMSQMIVQLKASNLFMSMMINRTIDFTKASQGRVLSPKMASIDILETLEWPLNCMKSMKTGIPINFESYPMELSKYVITDKEWLQENILCLISNAVKYSSDGSVDVRVTLHHSSQDSSQQRQTQVELQAQLQQVEAKQNPMIRFEVEDHGIGIPVEMRQELFAPFKQAQRLGGGTGLGLYSMLRRMEALSGSCGVEDRRDGQQGSLFWFMMPYKPDHCPTPSAAIPPNAEVSEEQIVYQEKEKEPTVKMSSSKKLSYPCFALLVVDDSLPTRKSLEMALTKLGHVVQTACNGAEALHRLTSKEEVYDVVVMDLQMPVMDGMEAVKRLRAHECELRKKYSKRIASTSQRRSDSYACTHQLIIGTSANSDDETRNEALEVGMDGFLPKPFSVSVLLETVNKMISMKEVDKLV